VYAVSAPQQKRIGCTICWLIRQDMLSGYNTEEIISMGREKYFFIRL